MIQETKTQEANASIVELFYSIFDTFDLSLNDGQPLDNFNMILMHIIAKCIDFGVKNPSSPYKWPYYANHGGNHAYGNDTLVFLFHR